MKNNISIITIEKLETKYSILEALGNGCLADVYKAYNNEDNRTCVLLVYKSELELSDIDMIQMFSLQKELEKCPYRKKTYNTFKYENRIIIEQEYIDGCTLFKYCNKHKIIPVDLIYRFINNIGTALAYYHKDINNDNSDGRNHAIVHNDLHTNNIIVKNSDKTFVLLNSEFSKQDNTNITGCQIFNGAIEYHFPEKLENEATNSSITSMSDIYSFGIILFELLAGTVPYPIDLKEWDTNAISEVVRIQNAHQNAPIPAIEPLRKKAYEEANPGKTYEKDYPEWLENVVRKCLAKNPIDRYHDARELLDDIKTQITI